MIVKSLEGNRVKIRLELGPLVFYGVEEALYIILCGREPNFLLRSCCWLWMYHDSKYDHLCYNNIAESPHIQKDKQSYKVGQSHN